jgi:hypothetical protein
MGSNFFFTFPTSEGSDLLSSHVMQTPTFISKLSDGNVIFRLDVGKKIILLHGRIPNKFKNLSSAPQFLSSTCKNNMFKKSDTTLFFIC